MGSRKRRAPKSADATLRARIRKGMRAGDAVAARLLLRAALGWVRRSAKARSAAGG